MRVPLVKALRGYKLSRLPRDLMGGLVVTALTIPTALGYAQIAGLPAIYGLYGSVAPLLAYALLSSTSTVVVGMDSAGSAIMGSVLMGSGVALMSDQAVRLVPLISMFVGIWLILFAVLRLGRVMSFVSLPVMGGFITGVSLSVMAGQVVQIMGVPSSGGEFTESIVDIVTNAHSTNLVSLALGATTFAVVMLGKRFCPKVPVIGIVLVAAIVLDHTIDLGAYGVAQLGSLPQGFMIPMPTVPTLMQLEQALQMSVIVALVALMESLLTANTFAAKAGQRTDDNQEMLAFGVANLMSALSASSVATASVSRSAASHEAGSTSQLANIFAAVLVVLTCLFLTPLLEGLPQPVLAGIVLAALTGVLEVRLAARLLRVNWREFAIFAVVFVSVLLVGVVFGVLVGIVCSLINLLTHTMDPPRYFMGMDPITGEFGPAGGDSPYLVPAATVIYRMTGSLVFVNVRLFSDELLAAVTDETRIVMLDCCLITSFDYTGLEQTLALIELLRRQGKEVHVVGLRPDIKASLDAYELDLDKDVMPIVDDSLADALRAESLDISPLVGRADSLDITTLPGDVGDWQRRAVTARQRGATRANTSDKD